MTFFTRICLLVIGTLIRGYSSAQCTSGYSTSPSSGNYPATAGTASFQVNIPSGCGYFAIPGNCFTWIGDVQSGPTGTVTFFRSANTSCNSRSCSIVITNGLDQVTSFNVTQQGLGSISAPGPISGTSTFCGSESEQYSIASVNGATSYTWSFTGEGVPSGSGTSIEFTPLSSGVLSVVANNNCGSSAASNLSIDIIETPIAPVAILGDISTCVNDSGTFSIEPVADASSYVWSFNGDSITTTSDTSMSFMPAMEGTLSVMAMNQCGISPATEQQIQFITVPDQPVSISGEDSVCMNSTNTYSVVPVAGAISYSWNLAEGWTGGSDSTSIIVDVADQGGELHVAAVNQCGMGEPVTFQIDMQASTLSPGPISGPSVLCNNFTTTYSIEAVPGALDYMWEFPDQWTGIINGPTIGINAGSGSGSIGVSVFDGCVNSEPITLDVTVGTIPAMPSPIIGGSLAVCPGATQAYSVTANAQVDSYVWTLPNASWSGTSTSASIQTTVGSTGGPLQVAAVNACGTGPARTANITVLGTPAPLASISGDGTPCINEPTNYIATYVAGMQYVWNFTGAAQSEIITSSNQVSITWTDVGVGTIAVAAMNSCDLAGPQIDNNINVQSCAFIDEHGDLGDWQAYPNPAVSEFNLHYSGGGNIGLTRIEIFDLTGRCVLTDVYSPTSRNVLLIPIEQLSAGKYFIRLIHQDKRTLFPLMKI